MTLQFQRGIFKMIEELKELLKLIQHLPDYVMWVLAGILFYKVFIIGNIYALARYAINKLHDFLTKEKIVRTEITYRGLCINAETELLLHCFIRDNLTYVFESDVKDLMAAWLDFKSKDKK